MSPTDQLVMMAKGAAGAHGLPPDLVCAVVEQESSWNPWAIRYEPAFYVRYVMPLQEKGIVRTDTEAHARAFSWGLMQTMLQSVRELGYNGEAAALCEPSTGLYWGCKLLAIKFKEAGQNEVKALQLWNGGSNQAYSSEVLARLPHYK